MTPNQIDVTKNSPPVGYNPIAEIRGAMFHEIIVPFNGSPVWCQLTCLNYIQLKSCGDISCLNFDFDENKKPSIEEVIETKNAQEAICKLSLIRPSYDDIISLVTGVDFRISEKKEELKKLKKEIQALHAKEKKKATRRIEKIEYEIGFLLPDDTMSFITSWAIGADITDIKRITRDILLDAAIMADNGKDNPTDHITGIFTDFQKEDINKHAWYIYKQFIEDKKREKNLKKNKYQWIGGKNK